MPKTESVLTSYLGIDPGKSGGMVLLRGKEVIVSPIPESYQDLFAWIDGIDGECFCVIEKVGGYVGDKGNPGSAMFKFGQNYGALLMSLTAASIPFEEITPQKWQKSLGIQPRKRTESKSQWKNRLKIKAQQLFPKEGVTLKTSDALLIAEFTRRYREGK